MQGRVDEAAEMMHGTVIAGERHAQWDGAALDSRRIRGGELFFALPGERTDGHRYVAAALEQGAAAAVVQASVAAHDGTLIEVDDSLAALHRLTRTMRSRAPEHLVAVTGSAGKTTTKELLAAMLARRFRTASSPGNLNNLYGFPLALLGIPVDTEWMVAEMGMSTPGELARVSRLGSPDVAVFTNVRPVHLEFFGSLRAIAEAKAELLEGLAAQGMVVANRDDPEVAKIARRHSGRVVWYGRREADYTITEPRPANDGAGTRFTLRAGDRQQEIALPLHGGYNAENFLAAAACAHELGIPLTEIAAAVSGVAAPPMRGVVHRLAGDRTVIDDSYNSNPSAVAAALSSARHLSARRRWAVLGDMLELGDEAPRFHGEVGSEAARLGFSPVVGVGPLARHLVAAAAAAGAVVEWFEDSRAAAQALDGRLAAGDLVLVKGSRGIGLERVVEALVAGEGEG